MTKRGERVTHYNANLVLYLLKKLPFHHDGAFPHAIRIERCSLLV